MGESKVYEKTTGRAPSLFCFACMLCGAEQGRYVSFVAAPSICFLSPYNINDFILCSVILLIICVVFQCSPKIH